MAEKVNESARKVTVNADSLLALLGRCMPQATASQDGPFTCSMCGMSWMQNATPCHADWCLATEIHRAVSHVSSAIGSPARRSEESWLRQVIALDSENAELRDALTALSAKLDAIEADEQFRGVFAFHMIHGGQYTGPSWKQEYEQARAALAKAGRAPAGPHDGTA